MGLYVQESARSLKVLELFPYKGAVFFSSQLWHLVSLFTALPPTHSTFFLPH